MKVATNAVIEDGVAVARCDNCGSRFYRGRASHRFCSISCNHQFHMAERRAALEWFRAHGLRVQREEAVQEEEEDQQRRSLRA